MRSQKRWRGIVVGIVMGVLLSAAVVLAGSLEPSTGPTEAGSQGNSSSYLPIVLKAGGSSSAAVPRTGQTPTVPLDPAPTGSDGNLQKGVAWPNPRFTDNPNGTVTDNLTGLIWLKNANCFGLRTWTQALSEANGLASPSCGLSDGSKVGQWRLPNVKELLSLIDWAYWNLALSNAAGTGKWVPGDSFTGVQSGYYWSSTTNAASMDRAWYVHLGSGWVMDAYKTDPHYVWPVRGGQ